MVHHGKVQRGVASRTDCLPVAHWPQTYNVTLFYVAFIKGRVKTSGGGWPQVEPCAAYGCKMELTIELTILMTGKQLLNQLL